jgi:hypothetical protein
VDEFIGIRNPPLLPVPDNPNYEESTVLPLTKERRLDSA